ncbi:MAG: hypothetical protein HY815_09030 [Candidatus Riflebacteria bacterium]|nr:hypothetical protein [Candidatus Riflebacteria bacterium]
MTSILSDLRALCLEGRQLAFSLRKATKQPGTDSTTRSRGATRLSQLKSRCLELVKRLQASRGLSATEQAQARKELAGIGTALREIEKHVGIADAGGSRFRALRSHVTGGWPTTHLPPVIDPAARVVPDGGPSGGVAVTPRPGSSEPESSGIVVEDGAPAAPVQARCPVCAEPVGKPRMECPRCGVTHHVECWSYSGGCAIFGCRRAR